MKKLYNVTYTNTRNNITETVPVWSESKEQAEKDVTFLAPYRTVNEIIEVNKKYFDEVIAKAKARRGL